MKIQRLDLLRYGPFTDVSFTFDTPGIHILVGHNEAGKTTTLGAIADALFDFPARTTAAFLHKMPELQVGMQLCNAAGTELTFTRKKRNKNPLERPDGSVLPEDELRAFLGAVVDRAIFESMYGIDGARLIAGGEDLLQGHGEWGEALFGAGAGISNLHMTTKHLKERSEALFKSGGANPTLNKAMKRHLEALAETKRLVLRPQEFNDAAQAVERAERDATEQRNAFTQLQERAGHLTRLLGVLPNLRQYRAVAAAVADLEPRTPSLRAEFSADVDDAFAKRRDADQKIASHEEHDRQLGERLAAIVVADDALSHAAGIADLVGQRELVVKAQEQRPAIMATLTEKNARAGALAEQLQPGLSPGQARDCVRISRVDESAITELADREPMVMQGIESASERVKDEAAEVAAAEEALQAIGPPIDLDALAAAAKVVGDEGTILARRETLAAQVGAEEQSLLSRIGALGINGRDLNAAAALAVPPKAWLQEQAKAAQDNARRCAEAEMDLAEAQQNLEDDSSLLRDLLEASDPPSIDDLTTARDARNARWVSIRDHWIGGQPDADLGLESPSAAATTYESDVANADTLADRLRQDAEAVERRKTLEAAIHSHRETVAKLEDSLAAIAVGEAERSRLWSERWTALGQTPDSPDAMLEWFAQHSSVLEGIIRLATERAKLEAMDQQIGHLAGSLRSALAAAGVPQEAPSTLDILHAHAIRLVDEATAQGVAHTAQVKSLAKARRQLATAETAAQAAVEKQGVWQEDFSTAVRAIGLEGGESERGVRAYLADAAELRSLVDETIADLDERLRAMDAAIDGFGREVGAIAAALVPDMTFTDSVSTLDHLRKLGEQATKDAEGRKVLDDQRKDLATKVDEAKVIRVAAGERLHSLATEAGVSKDDDDALRGIAERSASLHAAIAHRHDLEVEIASQTGGRTVGTIETLLTLILKDGPSVDDLESVEAYLAGESQRITTDLTEADTASQSADGELSSARAALALLDGSSAAANAQSDAEAARADILTAAEEYVSTRLARLILDEEMDSYRQANQGPMLMLAKEYFARITCASFGSLEVDTDDKGAMLLHGVRPDGTYVPVDGMSQGTRDQLYLALRLAAVVVAAEKQESFPLVLDDLFSSFDDDRIAATLVLLSELSEHMQVLLFSHQHHLKDLAATALGSVAHTIHDVQRASA